MSGRHPRLLSGAWVGRASLDMNVSAHCHRLGFGRCLDWNGLDGVCIMQRFRSYLGFTPLWSSHCCEEPGRVFVWSEHKMMVS